MTSLLNASRTDPLLALADLLSPGQGWASDPVGFIRDRLEEFVWSRQGEVIEAVRDHRRTAVQSCHGIGKSHIASRTAAWWLESYPAGEAFVVSTAPTFEQVRAVLWRYIGQVHRKAKLRGRVNQTEWFIGDELVAFGRKPADDDPTAFQGIHAPRVLVILDEACGIPRELWTAALSLASNDDSRILAIGNPDDPRAYFAEVCSGVSGWHVLKISAFDTPNFTGEAIPLSLSRELIGPTYVEEMKRDCGEGSAPYMAKVLGKFPVEADDGVVSISAATACRQPPEKPYEPDQLIPRSLGVDVGGGGDYSVIIGREGPRAKLLKVSRTPDTMELVGQVLMAIDDWHPDSVKVDKTGIGFGVTDRLEELRQEGRHNARIVGVMTGSASSRPDRFPKLRDQLWWEVGRQLSADHAWDLSALPDTTIAQLTAPKYAPDSSGRVKVEKKDETKKRLGHSPDEADALLLAFYELPVRRGLKVYPRR